MVESVNQSSPAFWDLLFSAHRNRISWTQSVSVSGGRGGGPSIRPFMMSWGENVLKHKKDVSAKNECPLIWQL